MMGLDAAVSERILAQFLVEMDGIEELKEYWYWVLRIVWIVLMKYPAAWAL